MVIIGKDTVLQGTRPQSPRNGAGSNANKKFQRCSIRVLNLEASIKFYCQQFGFRVQKMLDVPGGAEEEQRAILAASDTATFNLELIQDSTVPAVTPGDWFLHFTLIVPSTSDVIQNFKESGHGNLILDERAAVIPIRSLSSKGGQSTQDIVALVKDLDNYTWQIMEAKRSGAISEPLCSITLRTTNIEKTIANCSRVLGTTVSQNYEASHGPPEYKTAMLGFGAELETVQLEFRQTETPPLVQRGNGVIRIVVGCDGDLTGVEKELEEAEEVVEKVEIGSVDEPGLKETALAMVLEPDGLWEVCFVSKN
jgi:catechol 2,3-dioxygenase-like lactoylglutathione lyase family enzyme